MTTVTTLSVFISLFLVPIILLLVFGPVLEKAGYSKWWSLLIIVPFANLLSIWLFAFLRWPSDRNS